MAYVINERNKSGGAKNYTDTRTGEIISNRQFLNRTKAIPQGFSTYSQKLKKQRPLSSKIFKLSKTRQTTYSLDSNGDIEGQILSIIDAVPNQSGLSGITVVIEGDRELRTKKGSKSSTKRTGAQTQVEAPTADGVANIIADIEEVEDKYDIGNVNAYYLIVIEDA